MKKLIVVACLLLALPAAAQQSGAPAVAYPPLLIQDEGSAVARATRALNFVGTSIACANASGVITCTVSAGGGSGNFLDVALAMTGGSGYYSATVTGQAWVTGTSKVVCAPFGTTADGLTVEQIAAANLTVSVSSLVAGTGFTINVFNPFGSHGTHRFHCTGA